MVSPTKTVETLEMRGDVILWNGKHSVIRSEAGGGIDFLPLHLAANGYSVRAGDQIRLRCAVITTRVYCMDTIRAGVVSRKDQGNMSLT